MATETFKRSSVTITDTGAGSPITGQLVYTVPGTSSALIIGIRVANIDGAGAYNVSVFVDQGANNYYVSGKATPIPAQSALELMEGKKCVEVKKKAVSARPGDRWYTYRERARVFRGSTKKAESR